MGGDGLVAESAAYLAQEEHQNRCTVAAAFLALAWSRIPVYGAESDALVRRAQAAIHAVSVAELVVSYRVFQHPLLPLLDDLSSNFSGFLVDSGYYYYGGSSGATEGGLSAGYEGELGKKQQQEQGDGPNGLGADNDEGKKIDYTRHMMVELSSEEELAKKRETCVVPFAFAAKTGLCDPYAAIGRDLALWRPPYGKGVSLRDVQGAFNQVTDAKHILFRWSPRTHTLFQVLPSFSHLNVTTRSAGDEEAALPVEPRCIAEALMDVLAKTPNIPPFDIVVNNGDLPLLRKSDFSPPFYNLAHQEAARPAPLFSIATNEEFFDILFPNVCRPALVNLTAVVMGAARESLTPWSEKKPVAFWRGTDRGSVNWARFGREMEDLQVSPRKAFLEEIADDPHFDAAFLADELLDSSVVDSDPNFVPLDRQQQWKYVLDLPGNGYSGGLKQKLTSSSAVLMSTDPGNRGQQPLYEHYYLGLIKYKHVLAITNGEDAKTKLDWARTAEGDKQMEKMVGQANRYMEGYERVWRCYIWRLLVLYAEAQTYDPGAGEVYDAADGSVDALGDGGPGEKALAVQFPGGFVHRYVLRRTATREEGEAFEKMCREDLARYQ